MTITAADIRDRIAERLNVKAVEMALADEDASKIDTHVGFMLAELKERGLVWWADDAIPEAVVFALTLIGAAQTCTLFGKAGKGHESGDMDGRSRLASLKPSALIEHAKAVYY